MLAWSEKTDNGRQETEILGYDVIVGGSYLLITPVSRKLVAKPKTQINRRRTRFQLLSRWWDAYPQTAWPERLSERVRTLWQIKERGAMIDRGDIRQAIDRCSNIWASLPGAGYGQFEHKADSLIAKFKEAGGTVREIDVSRVTAIISALVICIIVCLSWAVNHYRDNAIAYKPSATKMPEN